MRAHPPLDDADAVEAMRARLREAAADPDPAIARLAERIDAQVEDRLESRSARQTP